MAGSLIKLSVTMGERIALGNVYLHHTIRSTIRKAQNRPCYCGFLSTCTDKCTCEKSVFDVPTPCADFHAGVVVTQPFGAARLC